MGVAVLNETVSNVYVYVFSCMILCAPLEQRAAELVRYIVAILLDGSRLSWENWTPHPPDPLQEEALFTAETSFTYARLVASNIIPVVSNSTLYIFISIRG